MDGVTENAGVENTGVHRSNVIQHGVNERSFCIDVANIVPYIFTCMRRVNVYSSCKEMHTQFTDVSDADTLYNNPRLSIFVHSLCFHSCIFGGAVWMFSRCAVAAIKRCNSTATASHPLTLTCQRKTEQANHLLCFTAKGTVVVSPVSGWSFRSAAPRSNPWHSSGRLRRRQLSVRLTQLTRQAITVSLYPWIPTVHYCAPIPAEQNVPLPCITLQYVICSWRGPCSESYRL